MQQRTGGDHLGVEPGVARDLAMEDAAVAVGPIHHGRNRQGTGRQGCLHKLTKYFIKVPGCIPENQATSACLAVEVNKLSLSRFSTEDRPSPQIESPQGLRVAGWCPLYPLRDRIFRTADTILHHNPAAVISHCTKTAQPTLFWDKRSSHTTFNGNKGTEFTSPGRLNTAIIGTSRQKAKKKPTTEVAGLNPIL
jgi:hypothetical protein